MQLFWLAVGLSLGRVSGPVEPHGFSIMSFNKLSIKGSHLIIQKNNQKCTVAHRNEFSF